MSEILDRLSQCERVLEWVDPWDPRLEKVIGLPAPQRSGADRMGWEEDRKDWPRLVDEVTRIIVPTPVISRVVGRVKGSEDWGTVILDIPSVEDWAQCFPVDESQRTKLELPDLNRTAWAAVGKCAMEIGLGIFAELNPDTTVEVRVQLIPEEVVIAL